MFYLLLQLNPRIQYSGGFGILRHVVSRFFFSFLNKRGTAIYSNILYSLTAKESILIRMKLVYAEGNLQTFLK